ncbi:MAG: PH domain-containing protein [Massilia sp.]
MWSAFRWPWSGSWCGPLAAQHYFDRLEREPGPGSLRYRKGILVTTEKTIPLEKIQDLSFLDGPIPRCLHLATPEMRDGRQRRRPGIRHAPDRHH